MLNAINPKNTPVVLNKTETKMIIGAENLLNCATIINKIKNKAIIKAPVRNSKFSACSCCSPVKLKE